MSIEYIRYKIPQDINESFLSDYEAASNYLRKSKYCLGYDLSRCVEEPDRYILRIQWTSTEDHLEKFRTSKEFQQFLPLIKPYIDNIEEMQHYELTKILLNK